MRKTIYVCDNCGKEQIGFMKGILGIKEKYYDYCSGDCFDKLMEKHR